ncbi:MULTISPECIES: type II toxin-antitoxin system PemK/MazF family toxin [Salinicoccus]|uniref:mRNA interferase n=1 Tax=Salinicoccus sediminis TaxID=1432562 RepID=A0A0M2SNC9_9STAP|nr:MULTISPECIES: type II toxin-antitoxin system PemK/MazF family toxin [Salinicoccus]KKK35196.1 PemK family transcriptional regulator [Salinicoccus sediminis]
MKRGEVYLADLSPVQGSEQGGKRPVVIIQNNIGNYHSPTVIVAAITGRINKAKIPTHVEISKDTYNLDKDSVILLEQIRTVDKKRLKEKLTYLNSDKMKEVDKALKISLELMPPKSGKSESKT